MRLVALVVALAGVVAFGCSGKSLGPIGGEGFLLVEQCTCNATGTTLYDNPNHYIGDDAPDVCDGGVHYHPDGGGGDCPSDRSCTPSCENTGSSDDCGGSTPPVQGGCWVTGGGYVSDVDGIDTFGGNGMPMKSGAVRGEWEHQDHGTQRKAHGQVRYLVCRHVDEPGPGQPSGPTHQFTMNQVYFGGPARWFDGGRWSNGFWFDVMAEDHGEPGKQDFYHFTLRRFASATQSGPVVYDTAGTLGGGNVQIHPPNNGHPYNGGALPAWVQLQP
jgi:hypothetical protein